MFQVFQQKRGISVYGYSDETDLEFSISVYCNGNSRTRWVELGTGNMDVEHKTRRSRPFRVATGYSSYPGSHPASWLLASLAIPVKYRSALSALPAVPRGIFRYRSPLCELNSHPHPGRRHPHSNLIYVRLRARSMANQRLVCRHAQSPTTRCQSPGARIPALAPNSASNL